jgi:hypothetical protein
MNTLEFIAEVLKAYAWPVVVIVLVLCFRKELSPLFANLKNAKEIKIGKVLHILLEREGEIKKAIEAKKEELVEQPMEEKLRPTDHIEFYQTRDIQPHASIPKAARMRIKSRPIDEIKALKNTAAKATDPRQSLMDTWDKFESLVWNSIQPQFSTKPAKGEKLIEAIGHAGFYKDDQTPKILKSILSARNAIAHGPKDISADQAQAATNFLLASTEALCVYRIKI